MTTVLSNFWVAQKVRPWLHVKQESRAIARKPRDAAAILFG